MCWSAQASTVLAVSGMGMTAYLIKKGEKKELWLPLFYFTLMGLLQVVTYSYIHHCTMPMNKVHTFLGYAHIAFQPFFVNMAAMCFIPEAIKNKISPYVYAMCWIGIVPFMIYAYPFFDTSLCTIGKETMCVPFACSFKENWHIAWLGSLSNLSSQLWVTLSNNLPSLGVHAQIYLLNGFVLPIMYGSWRIILATLLFVPFIAYCSTNNIQSLPAIWCLYSVGLCCTLVKSPIRKYLYVYNWPLYNLYLTKRPQPLTLEQSKKIVEQDPPIDIKTTTVPIYSNSLPFHEFQLMYWLSGFSEPVCKTLNIVDRKRFQGRLNKIALDAALQLVLQKQEIFSYHIHRFYPLHTLCTRPSIHFRQSTEISLLSLSDDLVEAYLAQKYDNLYYEKTWRANRPWISIDLYDLKHDQVELQVCMSQLVADERSMTIFFRELSNAYLFFTHQTHTYTLDSFQSYQHYVTQQNIVMQEQAQVDEIFWAHYLQDSSWFCFPKRYVMPYKKPAYTQIPLPTSFISKLQQFCTQYHVEAHDVLCAAVSLSLLQCCDNDINCVPNKLCISLLKSTREDPQYDNTIGCFLRMETIKLDLHNQPSLVHLTKQAQESTCETARYQRAPTLVKLAAIGKLPKIKKPVAKFFVSSGLTLISKCFPKWQLNKSIIHACENMASSDRKKQFLICMDIANHFLDDTKNVHQPALFGLAKQNTPLHMPPIHTINYVLNLIFHRSNDQNIPFLAVVGNLTPEFKTRFGEKLVSMMEDSVEV